MAMERKIEVVIDHWEKELMKTLDDMDSGTYNVKGMKKKFSKLFDKMKTAYANKDYDETGGMLEEISSEWDNHFEGDNSWWAENNAIEAMLYIIDPPSPEDGGTPETLKYIKEELESSFNEMDEIE